MRWLTARRQFVAIEYPATTGLAVRLLTDADPQAMVWPESPASWIARHDALTNFFGISTRDLDGLTPASLRGGGATWLFRRCGSADVVRWRGRWQSHRSVEIYVQEVMTLEVMAALPAAARRRVELFASAAEELLSQAAVD